MIASILHRLLTFLLLLLLSLFARELNSSRGNGKKFDKKIVWKSRNLHWNFKTTTKELSFTKKRKKENEAQKINSETSMQKMKKKSPEKSHMKKDVNERRVEESVVWHSTIVCASVYLTRLSTSSSSIFLNTIQFSAQFWTAHNCHQSRHRNRKCSSSNSNSFQHTQSGTEDDRRKSVRKREKVRGENIKTPALEWYALAHHPAPQAK